MGGPEASFGSNLTVIPAVIPAYSRSFLPETPLNPLLNPARRATLHKDRDNRE